MKFEKIDGEQYIILGNNEKVYLTTVGRLKESKISIVENYNKINIFGNSEIIDSIRGEGMLEKVYMPPLVSSSEILNKCDKWLKMFKHTHDIFRKLVLSENFRKHNIVMRLSFSYYFSLEDGAKGNTINKECLINLELMQDMCVIREGMRISIDEINEDIFVYLMANVIDYYISKNYEGTEINYENKDWDKTLYSNSESQKFKAPIISRLGLLYSSEEYSKIITSLLASHNLGISSAPILSNLRNRISSQQLSDEIDKYLDYCSKQYKYIISEHKEEKQTTLNKTLKKK